jgi:MFS superfamily sulfate permease-like transporter
MVVGALIFVLGIDLVKEALWDTRNRVSRTEYITIFSIMVVMTAWDFVIGVLFGIVISCTYTARTLTHCGANILCRLLFRRAKFPGQEYPCFPHWRIHHVDRPKT